MGSHDRHRRPNGSSASPARLRVAVLGLGEAGSAIARDLAPGADVRAYDPAVPVPPAGVAPAGSAAAAVADAAVVLAVTPARHAATALGSVVDDLARGAVYADLATASPGEKRALAGPAAAAGALFADVALMGVVSRSGGATPALASGPGARRLAALVNPLGMQLTVVGDEPGAAATRKLLRSVLLKGLAAVLIEALRGAHAAGVADWFWAHATDELQAADRALAHRLVEGTGVHAARRLDETEAAIAMLRELGEEPHMTPATLALLHSVLERGVPPTISDRTTERGA
jgi:3-hydroxyisobutyrate dehydrogenase-like beta-hydroxyacid dehydrogenase